MADEPKLTLTDAKEKIEELRNRARRLTEKADGVIEKVVTSAVTIGAATSVGIIEGYNGGDFKIGQIEGSAALAIVAHGIGAMGDSKYADQLHAAGNGFGSVWGYKTGQKVGKRMRENKDTKGSVFGAQPAHAQLPGRSPYDAPEHNQNAVIVHQGE